MHTLEITSQSPQEFIDITAAVRRAIRSTGVRDGSALLFVPHTTAAVTLNENADSGVTRDLIVDLRRLAPASPAHRHGEGNSPAHLLSSLVGVSLTLIISEGAPLLGTWQGIYFCEFDGPRRRQLQIKVIAG
ncbi:MAG: hypothetical protein A2091_09765 [Desulfuromonadales bacterium GWD2_61_12]|nr:MAG: hypothetical protein A2005_04680 [Desulfuromonadales bacterium GWC2_61_20]OGR32394.1 MAG: hypothetical protein A2091_09765 [Desulfuromonadales bacterium GWD2_61_12]